MHVKRRAVRRGSWREDENAPSDAIDARGLHEFFSREYERLARACLLLTGNND
jgi:hypothetical protein